MPTSHDTSWRPQVCCVEHSDGRLTAAVDVFAWLAGALRLALSRPPVALAFRVFDLDKNGCIEPARGRPSAPILRQLNQPARPHDSRVHIGTFGWREYS